MSYRLIDANTLAISCKQVNDMPCIYADLPNGLDGNHYIVEQSESNRESRWFELFGTPERAAETLEKAQLETCDYCEMVDSRCDECRYEFDRYGCCEPAPLLEWLRGDAE